MTGEERIAVLETRFEELSKKFDAHETETRAENALLDHKLDSLLEIKNKGVGAFWLASALMGSGIIGLIVSFVQWMKG
jgi:hypothetical protein